MRPEQTIYQLANLTKSYDGRIILSIPSLSFRRGETCALVGPNGSGKTTLLKLLALVERPTAGRITFDSTPAWNGAANHTLLTRRITMVTHPPYMFNRSVAHNIAYGMKLRGMSRKHIRDKTLSVLKTVGLEGFERRDAGKLSSGEQQRVALARALALEPEVLLLDEPTASIDKKHAEEVESLIRRFAHQKSMTVIFSTHNHYQAAALAKRIISLYGGRAEPFSYENLFGGNIFERDGVSRIKLNGAITVGLGSESVGPAHISIDPCDITITRHPTASPSLNCYPGKITSMTMHDSQVQLIVDVGVRLTSIITQDSLKRLRLKLGEDVYCVFKTEAVKII